MTFAERLKYYREKAKYSQKELAEKIGLPFQTYNNYETKGSEPKIEVLIKLAAVLGVDVNTLVGYQENEKDILLALLRSAGIYFENDIDNPNALYIENAAIGKDLPKEKRIELAIHITFDDLKTILKETQKELQEVTYPIFTRLFFDKLFIFKVRAPYDSKDKMIWKPPDELPPDAL